MIRRTHRFLWLQYVALSAILFCASVVWGIRSCVRFDEIRYCRYEDSTGRFVQFVLTNYAGCVYVYHSDWPKVHRRRSLPPEGWRTDSGAYTEWSEPFRWSNITDFQLSGLTTLLGDDPDGITATLSLPYWFIAILSLPLPILEIRHWRNVRRVEREGLCRVCGYDLRASVDRCPECGTGFAVSIEKHGEAEWPVKTRES